MKTKTQTLTVTAIVAALYMVLTLAIQPLSYGAVQIRFAEILALLPFFNRKYSVSIIVGCALANIFSPLGPIDLIFGVASSALYVFIISHPKFTNVWAAIAIVVASTGLIVGAEIAWVYNVPFWFNAATVALGELVVMVLAVVFWKMMFKNSKVRELLQPQKQI